MEISPISTACKNCLFATYESDTQIGCSLNRTEKIKNHSIYELIEAEDEDKKFFILNNHICPYQRTSNWAHANDSDIVYSVMQEVRMSWAAILFYKNNGIGAVKDRIYEIKQQTIPPKIITLVVNANKTTNDEFNALYEMIDDHFSLWYLQKVFEDSFDERFIGDICVDKMKKHRFMFYAYFESDKPIDINYYDKIHKFVIDDMNSYGVIKDGDNLHNTTISKVAHIKYGGNSHGVPLEYKIEHDNKDLSWTDLDKYKSQTIKNKFIVHYSTL